MSFSCEREREREWFLLKRRRSLVSYGDCIRFVTASGVYVLFGIEFEMASSNSIAALCCINPLSGFCEKKEKSSYGNCIRFVTALGYILFGIEFEMASNNSIALCWINSLPQ